jgi:hypothetical protein
MNWRRGLRRTYVVLVAIWCLYAQHWVLNDHWQRVKLDVELAQAKVHGDVSGGSAISSAIIAADRQKLLEAQGIANMNGWRAIFTTPAELAFFLAVLVIPPLVFYLGVAATFLVVRWVIRGFKHSPPSAT